MALHRCAVLKVDMETKVRLEREAYDEVDEPLIEMCAHSFDSTFL